MRQRSVNEKAAEKLSTFIFELRGRLANKEHINFSNLYEKYGISKSTASALKRLGYIIEKDLYFEFKNPNADSDRIIAVKILEALRQRSDKQQDKPINDLWVQEISDIKRLLTEIRDNAKIEINGVDGLISSQEQRQKDRVYIAGHIASAIYSNQKYVCSHSFTSKSVIGPGGHPYTDHQKAVCIHCGYEPGNTPEITLEQVNINIITATDDLINKLYSK